MKPLVSIITPSYNQGRFIEKTVVSVLNQDYENIEYIIIDGGSTDNTKEIVEKYRDRLTFISEKDNGQSDAINKGFKMAKGEIVAWLNSDDVYEPGCISKAVDIFMKDEALGLIYGEGYLINEDGDKLERFGATQKFDLWTLIHVWDYIMQPATFFKKSYLEQVGYLDVNLHYCMDWDLWIKLATVSKVKYVNEFFACSREYGDTKTSTGGYKRLDEIKRLMQKYSKTENPIGYAMYEASTKYFMNEDNEEVKDKYLNELMTVQTSVLSDLPIRYEDGWIGAKYSMVVNRECKKIRIWIRHILPQNEGERLHVYVNEVLQQTHYLNYGNEYEIVIACNENFVLNQVNIVCSKASRPSEEDKRELSVIITKIEYN